MGERFKVWFSAWLIGFALVASVVNEPVGWGVRPLIAALSAILAP